MTDSEKLAVFLVFCKKDTHQMDVDSYICIYPVDPDHTFQTGAFGSYEVTTVFIWFWMITIRESLVFTEVLKVNENDMVMLRSFAMKPGTSFWAGSG